MSTEPLQKPQKQRSPSNLSGYLTAIVILMIVVIALIIAMVVGPDLGTMSQSNLSSTTTPVPLSGTPEAGQVSATPVSQIVPPVVNIDKIIIIGGVLVLIVLAAILREILWYQKRS